MAGELLFPTINHVIISGRLTRDIELRYTPQGTPVVNMSIASDKYYKDSNGETQQRASFIDVVVWSKQAESCSKYLRKGSPVIVEGSLETRTYTDRNNNNRKVTEVRARRVNFLEKSNNYGAQQGSSGYNNSNNGNNKNYSDNNSFNGSNNSNTNTTEITEDDVPF